MTDGAWEVVGRDYQKLPFEKTIGDAFRDLITRRFRHKAVKELEERYRVDPKTARNVVQRAVVSTTTLTKAAHAERWALWMALGEELFEQSYEDHLQEAANEQQQAADRARARQDHIRALEARAGRLVDFLDGPDAH